MLWRTGPCYGTLAQPVAWTGTAQLAGSPRPHAPRPRPRRLRCPWSSGSRCPRSFGSRCPRGSGSRARLPGAAGLLGLRSGTGLSPLPAVVGLGSRSRSGAGRCPRERCLPGTAGLYVHGAFPACSPLCSLAEVLRDRRDTEDFSPGVCVACSRRV